MNLNGLSRRRKFPYPLCRILNPVRQSTTLAGGGLCHTHCAGEHLLSVDNAHFCGRSDLRGIAGWSESQSPGHRVASNFCLLFFLTCLWFELLFRSRNRSQGNGSLAESSSRGWRIRPPMGRSVLLVFEVVARSDLDETLGLTRGVLEVVRCREKGL